ncbi:MAG: DapH/DapD/GlmU-related protein [Candidatus Thorarchaeota archaeon]
MNVKEKVHPSAVIEKEVKLAPDYTVEPYVFLRGKIQAGKRCYFSTGCKIQGPANIGNNVFFGEQTTIGFPTQHQIEQYQKEKKASPWMNSELTEIGDDCIIRAGSVLYSSSKLGNNVRIGHNVLLRENVQIGDNSLVGTSVTIDGNSSIGKKVSIQTNVYIPWNTIIEDHVFLGPHCVLTNDKYVMRTHFELKGPIIRRGVSIGAGAVILPAIEIGEKAVIGAGAVVTKNVPPKTIVHGVPARVQSVIPENWKIPLE